MKALSLTTLLHTLTHTRHVDYTMKTLHSDKSTIRHIAIVPKVSEDCAVHTCPYCKYTYVGRHTLQISVAGDIHIYVHMHILKWSLVFLCVQKVPTHSGKMPSSETNNIGCVITLYIGMT